MTELNRESRALSEVLEYLIQELGPKILNTILQIKRGQATKWIGKSGAPSEHQLRVIYSLAEVVSILRSHLSITETKLWLVSDSEYLYGIPAVEIRSRPSDVKYAALNRISRGEYYELLHRTLSENSLSTGGES